MKKNCNIVLVAYSGYPEPLSTWLHLDNGLALVAQSLIDEGHSVKIYDYQTLSTWERLFPYELENQLRSLKKQFDELSVTSPNLYPDFKKEERQLIEKILPIEDSISVRNRKVVIELADELIEEISSFSPDYIGFKLWSQKSFLDQIAFLSRLKHAFPKSKTVAGGPAAEMFEEHLLMKCEEIDYVIYGPGERSFARLIKQEMKNADFYTVPGLCFREEDKIAKTGKSYPPLYPVNWRVYDEDIYLSVNQKIKNFHVESSRGCAQKCQFCFHPLKSGRLIQKEVEGFIDEVQVLNQRYGASYFHLGDSNPPFKHLVNISKSLVKRNLHYGFMAFQSLRDMDSNELAWLKKANFDWFWIGLETGTEDTNTSISKNRSLGRLKRNWKMLKEMDFTLTGSLIIPCPGESETTVQNTIKMLNELQPDIILSYIPIIQPGTNWFIQRDSTKVNIEETESVTKAFLNTGIEWHNGNGILPMVFLSENLQNNITYNSKSYKEAFYDHKRFMKSMDGVIQNTLFRYSLSQIKNRSEFKQRYFKSQVDVGSAIITGNFESARRSIQAYNEVATGNFDNRSDYLTN